MEMEEQKAKEFLEKEIKEEPLEEEYFKKEVVEEKESKDFFEREIKKENDDFSEKIKEEPLDEDDFKKEISNSREIVDPWLQSNSNFFDMPNDEISNSSSQIIKQEPICSEPRSVVAMNDVKMEPIDELDDDLNSQMHLNHKIMEKPKNKPQNRRCSICSQSKPHKFLKGVDFVQDKLIVMVKLVLCGEYNLSDAQFLYKKKRLLICYAHYSEAFNAFCSVLRIQKLEEINSCSPELMQNLMRTVNAFWPQMSASGFRNILNYFIATNKNSLQMVSLEMKHEPRNQKIVKKPNQRVHNRRCSVCSQLKNRKLMKNVNLIQDKLIIAIKFVLRDEFTLAKAQSYMSGTMKKHICYAHFSEALKEICWTLRIRKLEELESCSSELMNKMMVTVNAICPQFTAMDFCDILENFISRNKHILQMPLRNMKLEEQESQSLISNESKNRSETGTSKTKNHHCWVCAQLKPHNELRQIKSLERKMIIMIGCILRGEYTMEEANAFIYETNECFICRIHFSHAIDEIYNALDIKHYYEFATCSAEKMNSLMIIVSNLIPQFDTWQFQNSFEKFVNSLKRLV